MFRLGKQRMPCVNFDIASHSLLCCSTCDVFCYPSNHVKNLLRSSSWRQGSPRPEIPEAIDLRWPLGCLALKPQINTVLFKRQKNGKEISLDDDVRQTKSRGRPPGGWLNGLQSGRRRSIAILPFLLIIICFPKFKTCESSLVGIARSNHDDIRVLLPTESSLQ